MVLREFLKKNWLQFGGHADGCYNLLEVALKETREESGLNQLINDKKKVWISFDNDSLILIKKN